MDLLALSPFVIMTSDYKIFDISFLVSLNNIHVYIIRSSACA